MLVKQKCTPLVCWAGLWHTISAVFPNTVVQCGHTAYPFSLTLSSSHTHPPFSDNSLTTSVWSLRAASCVGSRAGGCGSSRPLKPPGLPSGGPWGPEVMAGLAPLVLGKKRKCNPQSFYRLLPWLLQLVSCLFSDSCRPCQSRPEARLAHPPTALPRLALVM